MPAPSFEATLFDYLRIVFHRWQWIIGLLLISVGMSWVWVDYIAPKRYRSSMVVLVWSRDTSNPNLRRFFAQAPLDTLLRDIRNRLQIESRLRRLTGNLRYGVKRDYIQKKMLSDKDFILHSAYKAKWRTRLAEKLDQFPYDVKRDNLDVEVSKAEFVRQIDTQGLATILTGVKPDSERLVDQMLLEDGGHNVYFDALRKKLFHDNGHTVSEDEVRRAAEKALLDMMAKGSNAFTQAQVVELLKEFLAMEYLSNTHLYFVVGDYYTDPERRLDGWVAQLKGGLLVSSVQGNLITFEYASAYASPRYVISDVVVRVVFAMVEAEFRHSERRLWNDTYGVIYKARQKYQAELDLINKEIYNFKKLSSLQLSFVPLGTDESSESLRKAQHWSDPFTGLPNTSTHIQRIDKHLMELRDIEQNIRSTQSVIRELELRIADPKRRVVRIERQTKVGDPPEVMSLRQRIVVKQLEMTQLLRTRTQLHPQVKKLQQELNELEGSLRAVKGQVQIDTGKDVEIKTNPQVQEWQEKLDAARVEYARLQEMGKLVEEYIEAEKKKAEGAILQQRDFRSRVEKQQILMTRLSRLQNEEEELRAQERAGKDFRPMFEVYTDSRRPIKPFDPKKELVLLMGFLVGLLAAATSVFMLEYTDHSIKTAEDIKRFVGIPVLGEIPEFSFGEIERRRRKLEMARRGARDEQQRLYRREEDLPQGNPLYSLIRMALIVLLVTIIAIGAAKIGAGPLREWYEKALTMFEKEEESLDTQKTLPVSAGGDAGKTMPDVAGDSAASPDTGDTGVTGSMGKTGAL